MLVEWGVRSSSPAKLINDIYLTSDQKLKLNNCIIISIIIIIIYQTLPSNKNHIRDLFDKTFYQFQNLGKRHFIEI